MTPRRIESWRQAGALPRATWAGGSGEGSTPTYRPSYAQALAARVAIEENRTLGQAALVLWADGWDVPADKLRRAANAWLEGQIARYEGKFGGDPERAASAMAFTIARAPTGKLWMQRAGGEDPFRSLGDGLAQAFRLGFHDPDEAPKDQEEFEQIGSVRSMAGDAFAALGIPVPAQNVDASISSTLSKAAASAFREASPEEWELARSFALLLRALLPEQPDFQVGFNRALCGLALLTLIHNEIGANLATAMFELLMNT